MADDSELTDMSKFATPPTSPNKHAVRNGRWSEKKNDTQSVPLATLNTSDTLPDFEVEARPSFCGCCLHKYNPLPDDANFSQRAVHAIRCPPHGTLANLLVRVVGYLLVWATTWAILKDAALPGGHFFALIVITIAAIIGGEAVKPLKLPPLLGMMIAGFILNNVPYIDIAKNKDNKWSSALRLVALAVILIRAGLGLDSRVLRAKIKTITALSFTPCVVEGCTLAILSHFILGFPWPWGFMFGFCIASVSPAVVVPSMLILQQEKLGTNKGIPSVIIAASAVENVLSIAFFGIFLGIVFESGSLTSKILQAPLELLIGCSFGVVIGILLWYLPHQRHTSRLLVRVLFIAGVGLLSLFGLKRAGFPGAGALGCLLSSFVAQQGWRKHDPPAKAGAISVAQVFGVAWSGMFQPILFGLIGAEVDITRISPGDVGYGVLIMFIALIPRFCASATAGVKCGLSLKEKLFIAISGFPKATVQAALGPIALDTARRFQEESTDPDADHEGNIRKGTQILTVAVLAIVITAPIGAVAIKFAAQKMLHKQTDKELENEREENA